MDDVTGIMRARKTTVNCQIHQVTYILLKLKKPTIQNADVSDILLPTSTIPLTSAKPPLTPAATVQVVLTFTTIKLRIHLYLLLKISTAS